MENIRNYECDECHFKFKQYQHLKRHISAIHLKEKPHKCEYCDFVCSHKPNLLHHSCKSKIENDPLYRPEKIIQKRLATELNGKCEISCDYGKIDLLTHDTIIEIKKWGEHKKAIGQLLGYSIYFPTYKKRIHFFSNKVNKKQMQGIYDVCKFYNIEITEE